MCIECSGKHRLLGLHLSQIKSITMDKWTEKEIEKIQHGGNKNFKDFIESHSAFNSQWTFEERYQSQVRFINIIYPIWYGSHRKICYECSRIFLYTDIPI